MEYIRHKDKASIAIITLYGNINFGNKLQNYATQEYFTRLGFDVATIPYFEEEYRKPILYNAVLFHLKRLSYIALKRTHLIRTVRRGELYLRREKKFKAFSTRYLVLYRKVMYSALPFNFKRKFDYFVTGSDQVWHCAHNDPKELKYFFLMFADPSQRVTMSPSFGFDKPPGKYIDIYRKGLQGFRNISCREASGVEIIKEFTNTSPALLLDPCMLVDESLWYTIMKKPAEFECEKGYILLYSLGGIPESIRDQTTILSREYDLKIIDLYNETNEEFVTTGPEEFLYYINNSTLVITDSFHAVLFSVLFKKRFYVYYRNDNTTMGNRINTILERFSLEDVILSDEIEISLEDDYMHKYDNTDMILKEERHKAIDFYKSIFKGMISDDIV